MPPENEYFLIIFTSFDKLRDDRKAEAWMMSITRKNVNKSGDFDGHGWLKILLRERSAAMR